MQGWCRAGEGLYKAGAGLIRAGALMVHAGASTTDWCRAGEEHYKARAGLILAGARLGQTGAGPLKAGACWCRWADRGWFKAPTGLVKGKDKAVQVWCRSCTRSV